MDPELKFSTQELKNLFIALVRPSTYNSVMLFSVQDTLGIESSLKELKKKKEPLN